MVVFVKKSLRILINDKTIYTSTQEMTVLTSLDITIENPDLDDKKVTRNEDGVVVRGQGQVSVMGNGLIRSRKPLIRML